MAFRLRWRHRAGADEFRVYRSAVAFDQSSLPAALANLPGSAREFVDDTAEVETFYWYAVGAVRVGSPELVALSRLISAAGEPVVPGPGIPAASYVGATVRLTASDDVEAQALPWDEVTERGTSGFWSGGNPTRLVVPSGASLVQVTAQLRFAGGSTFSGAVFSSILFNGGGGTPQPAASHRRQVTNSNVAQTLSYRTGAISVTPGDYFELFWNCSNAANAVIVVDSTWMEMEVLA